ncbi:dienelactone hydrolase family protein [Actinomadura fulvescens]|uniref:Dienelactone hydrolase family protein n=1 Tax=Actinomadura fulvescens TaxID=46160 RepID=A0ABP6D371_9ACTN
MGHLSHGPANRGRRVLQTAAPLFVREPWAPGPPRGGVIVLHDVFGVTEYAEDACRRLARDGWLAVSPYLYYEHGGPAFDAGDLAVARREMAGLRAEDLTADIEGAISYLRERGAPKIAVVGFSMGGHLATWAAAQAGVAGAVAVSPSGLERAPWDGLPPLELLLADRKAPWLGVAGEEDRRLPADAAERLRLALTAPGPPAELVEIPGAGHGFYRPGRTGFDPEASAESWRRIRDFLRTIS